MGRARCRACACARACACTLAWLIHSCSRVHLLPGGCCRGKHVQTARLASPRVRSQELQLRADRKRSAHKRKLAALQAEGAALLADAQRRLKPRRSAAADSLPGLAQMLQALG